MVISSNRAPRRPVLGRDCLFLLVVPGSGRSVSSSNTSSSDSDSTSTMRLDMLDRADFGERVGGSVKGIGDEQEMQRQSPITPRVDVADKAKPCSNCRCQKTPPPLTLRHTMICNRSLTLTSLLLLFTFLVAATPSNHAELLPSDPLHSSLRNSRSDLPLDSSKSRQTSQRRTPADPPPPPGFSSSSIHHDNSSVVCRADGLCERCPESSVREPFCQPYGNRRLIKCLPLTPENERALEEAARLALSGKPVPHSLGETPAWEACGKVIAVERADYWEFVLCNAFFASFSLFVVLARGKQLAALQYRRLAARIGL